NRINFILLVLLLLVGIFSFAYNRYLINQILKKERASVHLWAKATEYLANPLLEQSNRNLLKAADLLETIETVPDSITESIRSSEGIRSAQSFVVEQIILKNRYKIPTLILNEQGNVLNSSYISVPVDSSLVSKFIAY